MAQSHSRKPLALLFGVAGAVLLVSGCATAGAMSPGMSAPLNGEALRRLFLNGYNTYLAPVRPGEVITDHPSSELFRPNGTYSRRTGRFGPDGWYAIEGDRLCVTGDGIPKQCRKVVPQGGKTYLLIDVSDNSQALMNLWQVR
jgi:hypothetical protein